MTFFNVAHFIMSSKGSTECSKITAHLLVGIYTLTYINVYYM